MIPGAAYGLSVLFCGVIFYRDAVLTVQAALATLNAVIFSGFLMQYVKDRCYQLHIQKEINRFDNLGATVGDKPIDRKDRWFIKFAKTHVRAANYVFYVMLFTLLAYGAVAFYYIKALVSQCLAK